jgi:Mrp family chromosome partitioning ATPase
MTETTIAASPNRRGLSVPKQRLSATTGYIDSILLKLSTYQSERKLGSLCLALTSSDRRAGVSTIANSLALNASANGASGVLLVDVNAENPMQHHMSRIRRGPGLVDHLVKGEPLEKCIHKIAEPDTSLLMWGSNRIPPSAISPIRLDSFFSDLRTRFQMIILDLPTIDDAGYGIFFAAQADAVIMVLDGNMSRSRSVLRTMECLKEHRVEIMGTIMNRYKSPMPAWLRRWF